MKIMKKTYIIPQTLIVALAHKDGILTILSGQDKSGEQILGNGGTTKDKVEYSDVKRNNYNAWDDDWSK